MALNKKRIWIGGIAGGVMWNIWSFVIGYFVIGFGRYQAAQQRGMFLQAPRYPAFEAQWMILLFILAFGMAHLYAWSRTTLGPGPAAAIKVGVLVGFIAGFPLSFGQAAWSPLERIFPLGWMLEMWIGAILASLVAGALYKE